MSTSGIKTYTQKARYEEVFKANKAPKRLRLSNDPTTKSFREDDCEEVLYLHDDALLISLLISNCKMRRVLVDNGSSTDMLFWDTFTKMGVDTEKLRPSPRPLKAYLVM